MQFGICTGIKDAAKLREIGWNYIEANVKSTFEPELPDAKWAGIDAAALGGMPIPAANSLLPGELKIVGPETDTAKLDGYMKTALRRARAMGVRTIVFGAGNSRMLPAGFDPGTARKQILDFCRRSAPVAAQNGVTIVIEPLNRGETNTINTVAEAMTYVKEIDHPNLQCLVDSYHMWLEDEPLKNLQAAMPWIRHVHVANRDGRHPPMPSPTSDYRAFFRVLKEGKYEGLITVESFGPSPIPREDPRVLAYLKQEWNAA